MREITYKCEFEFTRDEDWHAKPPNPDQITEDLRDRLSPYARKLENVTVTRIAPTFTPTSEVDQDISSAQIAYDRNWKAGDELRGVHVRGASDTFVKITAIGDALVMGRYATDESRKYPGQERIIDLHYRDWELR